MILNTSATKRIFCSGGLILHRILSRSKNFIKLLITLLEKNKKKQKKNC